ncbi:MAG: hypothetical protein ACOYLO_18085 [Ferruginibacter sp.]
MKTPLLLSFALLAFFCFSTSTSFAKIWRVNNRTNIAADFTTAQAAHDGATAGDTIYFEPSPDNYGDIVLSKQLVIIGTGYFLDANPETQWKNNWPSTLNQISLNAGSEYSQLMGVTINGQCIVSATNITIKETILKMRFNLQPHILNLSRISVTEWVLS